MMKKEKILPILGLGLILSLSKPHLLYANQSFGGGSGTESDPYRLSTPEHLTQLQVAVDGGNSFSGKYFVLTNNINFEGYDNDDNPDNGNFSPIGYNGPFSGILDGNHYEIMNMRIIRPGEDYVGLFAETKDSTISNLQLTNIEIQGGDYVGGFTAYDENSVFSNISVEGEIIGGSYIGGVLGEVVFSKISYTEAKVRVTGDVSVGGIGGFSVLSKVYQSSVEGIVSGNRVVGGFFGGAEGGIIQESFIDGRVTGDSFVGGMFGEVDSGFVEDAYIIGEVHGIEKVGGLVGYGYYGSSLRNIYLFTNVGGTKKVGAIVGVYEDSSKIEDIYYYRDGSLGLSNIGSKDANSIERNIQALERGEMISANSKVAMSSFDFENVWKTAEQTPKLRWQKEIASEMQSDVKLTGNIKPLIADIVFPATALELVIDPNLDEGYVAPEFSILNRTASPVQLELKSFEAVTSEFYDVLPTKYETWIGLNRKQSEDLALGLMAEAGEGWQQLTTPTSYVANHQAHEIGVIKPMSQVNFEFDVHHGRAFSEAKKVQYRMVFVFDLVN